MTYLIVFMRCFMSFFVVVLLLFFLIMLWVQVDAIQMGTHNICPYKEVDKTYTGCYLKARELLKCVLIQGYFWEWARSILSENC